MSYYITWKFKCIIKEEYRKGFECIALRGEWDKSEIEELRPFKDDYWYIPNRNKLGNPIDTSWNEQTGEWSFEVEVNASHNSDNEDFVCDMKKYIEKILSYEYMGEYELEHGQEWVKIV